MRQDGYRAAWFIPIELAFYVLFGVVMTFRGLPNAILLVGTPFVFFIWQTVKNEEAVIRKFEKLSSKSRAHQRQARMPKLRFSSIYK